MNIKHQLKQGVSKAEIARQNGVCRQTVYNVLKKKRHQKTRQSLLEPYKGYIRDRLKKYPLSAWRIFSEIKEQGYSGGYSTVKPFVRQFKKRRVSQLITERYETPPGKQAQMDWGECGVIEHQGKRRKLYVFTYVLGYSRTLYAQFTLSMNQKHLLGCFQHCFEKLGVPEKVLVDNMKSAVNQHITGQEVQWNSAFLDFMEYHDVMPIAAPPYWPKVKGKVESGVKYVKNSFLMGQEFSDLDELNQRLQHWLDTVANVRIHGTTGEKPVERYAAENLRPAKVYVLPRDKRKVAIDCHISFQAARYSVPPEYVGKHVEVEAKNKEVTIWFEGLQVARHELLEKGQVSSDQQHMLKAREFHKQKEAQKPMFKQRPQPLSFDSEAYDELLGGIA